MNQTLKREGSQPGAADPPGTSSAQTSEFVPGSSSARKEGDAEIQISERNGAEQRQVGAVSAEDSAPFFQSTEAADLRSRWETIQIRFVDEPRDSLSQADRLVDEAIKRLSEGFAGERQKLEHQWDRGEGVSTEDLRILLRRYRSFFERLLSV